jgi:hypothetical protein
MKALMRAIKGNPKLSSALAGVLTGGTFGYAKGKSDQEEKPDGLILTALMPGSKHHLDEALRNKGYNFSGEDLRRISGR